MKKLGRRLKDSSELGKACVLAGISPQASSSALDRKLGLLSIVSLFRYWTPETKYLSSSQLSDVCCVSRYQLCWITSSLSSLGN